MTDRRFEHLSNRDDFIMEGALGRFERLPGFWMEAGSLPVDAIFLRNAWSDLRYPEVTEERQEMQP